MPLYAKWIEHLLLRRQNILIALFSSTPDLLEPYSSYVIPILEVGVLRRREVVIATLEC